MVRYEIKKVFARKGGLIALCILAATVLFVSWLAVSGACEWTNENGDREYGRSALVKLREAQKAWAGPLTEERIREVIEENRRIISTPEYSSSDVRQNNIAYGWRQGIMEIRSLLNESYAGSFREYDYYRADRLTPDMAGDFYANRVRLLKEWLYDEDSDAYFRFSDAEKAYLIRRYEELETPFDWDWTKGWVRAMEYYPTLSMIVLMVLSYLVAGIFSNEFQWKADPIFFSASNGRGSAVRAKILAGFLITTCVYWSAAGIYSLAVLGCLGFDGASCPVQSNWGMWKCFYDLSSRSAYLLVLFGGYVGYVFLAFLMMFVSAKSRSTVLGVLTPVLVIFLPNLVENMGTGSALVNKVLSLLPDRLLQLNNAIGYFDLFRVGGKVTGALPVLLALYVILSLALPPAIYAEYRGKEIV